MTRLPNHLLVSLIAMLILAAGLRAADEPVLPPQLTQPQKQNLLRFLKQHEKPDAFIPRNARVVGSRPAEGEVEGAKAPAKA